MKNKLILVEGLLFLLVGLWGPNSQADEPKPMNVIMIAVDDLNTWVGAWGGPAKTPHIDRLAAQGMAFKNAHAAVPACNPSRVAIFTGQRPEVTGQYTNEGNFRHLAAGKNLVTLPQLLKKHGFESVAAGKIFHKPRGINKLPDPMSDDVSWHHQAKVTIGTSGHHLFLDEKGHAKWLNGAAEFEGLKIGDYIRKFGVWGVTPQKAELTGDFQTAQFCADYIGTASNKPFFLACGIFRPHSPQLAPKEFFDLYPLDKIKLPAYPTDDLDDIPAIAKTNFMSGFARRVKSDPDELKRAMQGYLASTSFADAAIGKILNALENSPLRDNTIVVLWGDHGFQMAHKDRWEKFTLWDQATRTPLIVRVPGIAGGQTYKPVSLIDIYPTLIEYLNIKAPQKLNGHSLKPLIESPKVNWEHPAVITYEQGNNSIRFENWNYIRYKDGSEELYDHSNDKYEYKNLVSIKDYNRVVNQLRKWIPMIEHSNLSQSSK